MTDQSDTGLIRDIFEAYRILLTHDPEVNDRGKLDLWMFRIILFPFWWLVPVAFRGYNDLPDSQATLDDFDTVFSENDR